MQIAFEIETQQCQTKKGKEQTNYFMRFQSECILLTCSSLEDYCFLSKKRDAINATQQFQNNEMWSTPII